MRCLVIAFVLVGVPAFASTITNTTVTCSVPYPGGGYQSQTDPTSASCDVLSGYPLAGQSAVASGTVGNGMSGYAEACCESSVIATSNSSFTESFLAPTVLSWTLSAEVTGEWASVSLSDGTTYFDLCQGALTASCGDSGTITLSPGEYTFSLYVGDSEGGSAGGSAILSVSSECPEPGTVWLLASVLLLVPCGRPLNDVLTSLRTRRYDNLQAVSNRTPMALGRRKAESRKNG